MIWFSVRFDYDTVVHASRERVEAIAKVLAGPTFVSLRRVGTRVNKRRSNSTPRSAEAIAVRLRDTTQECVWLKGGTRDAVIASAQIQHGIYPAKRGALFGQFDAYAAFPVTMTAPAVAATCELVALRCRRGVRRDRAELLERTGARSRILHPP